MLALASDLDIYDYRTSRGGVYAKARRIPMFLRIYTCSLRYVSRRVILQAM